MGRISSIIDEILPIKIIIINVVHCTSPFGQCTPLRTHRLKWVTWANTRHKMLQMDFVTLEQVHSFFDLRQRSEILSKIARQSPNTKFYQVDTCSKHHSCMYATGAQPACKPCGKAE